MDTRQVPPQSARELLWRYSMGDRHFDGMSLNAPDLRGANLEGARLVGAGLFQARLDHANLRESDLQNADLCSAMMPNANLEGANLVRACLSEAQLMGANLAHADLGRADLSNAPLEETNLEGADLSGTDLSGAWLDGATLSRIRLGWTNLTGLDVSPLCEVMSTLQFVGPCTVDYSTIVMSLRAPGLKTFLQRTGMPEVFIEYMIDCARSLDPQGIFKMLQSTFISYGGPDTDFAQKLNDALLKNGVTTFFFAKDAIPGKKLHRLMRDGVNQHDRVILVCSKASLARPGVLNEITETLQREARDGGKEYLIPITLDDYVFGAWKPEDPGVAQAIRDRVVADFRGADVDQGKFDAGVLKLISALKK